MHLWLPRSSHKQKLLYSIGVFLLGWHLRLYYLLLFFSLGGLGYTILNQLVPLPFLLLLLVPLLVPLGAHLAVLVDEAGQSEHMDSRRYLISLKE